MDDLIQVKNLIGKSQNILIVPPQEIEGDSLASALALFSTLKKLGKNVNVVIDKIPDKFQFLTSLQPETSRDFVISLDTAGKEIAQLRYERNDSALKIYLTLNQGAINKKDISFSSFNQKLDLIITLGVTSLDEVGSFFEQNPHVFYETPILNIDNHPANENFGQLNLVDITSSLAETLTSLIKLMEAEDEAFLDKDVATSLLTGVICASQNFRDPKTRPHVFETSAYLIERGGDHQRIIQYLYKQKSVAQINLLGKVLEKLGFDEKRELYLATLTEKDFTDCRASSKDLSFVIEELKVNFRYLPNFLVLWESRNSPMMIKGVLYSSQKDKIEKILENYEGVTKGSSTIFLVKETDLEAAKEKILNII
jgi:nanoRNase/pAp phosphatase (c-di-AMP/oligoRNAs hydrolase)